MQNRRSKPSPDIRFLPVILLMSLSSRQAARSSNKGQSRREDYLRPLTDDYLRSLTRPKGRRFWIPFTAVLILLGAITTRPIFVACGLLILGVGIIPEIWYQVALRGVSLRRQFGSRQIPFGSITTLEYTVENRKWLPMPWLEVEDDIAKGLHIPGVELLPHFNPGRHYFIAGFSLWRHERITRRYKIYALSRGVWPFGPAFIRASDPFGLLISERPADTGESQPSLTILPPVVPLDRLGLPTREPFGAISARRRMLDDQMQVIGARDYQSGDPQRMIHWKATARATKLQSKIYQPTTDFTLVIFMDIRTTARITQGIEPDLLELGIAAAASISSWGIDQGYAVGIASNGLPGAGTDAVSSLADAHALMRVPPGQTPDHVSRLLRTLAQLQPIMGISMERIIAREESRLPVGSTVIYIGAAVALTETILRQLTRLQRHGHIVALILTGEKSDESLPGQLQTYFIGGKERWNDIRTWAIANSGHGDDLDPETHVESTGHFTLG